MPVEFQHVYKKKQFGNSCSLLIWLQLKRLRI